MPPRHTFPALAVALLPLGGVELAAFSRLGSVFAPRWHAQPLCCAPCHALLLPAVRFVAVLVGLYEEPERPPNAVDFIKKYLGAPVGVDIDALRAENERLKSENRTLHSTVEELNKRVRAVMDGCTAPAASSPLLCAALLACRSKRSSPSSKCLHDLRPCFCEFLLCFSSAVVVALGPRPCCFRSPCTNHPTSKPPDHASITFSVQPGRGGLRSWATLARTSPRC